MTDILIYAVFVLAHGAMGSVVGLAGALWFRDRELRLFKIFLFFAYLTTLFFMSGLRFGLETFAGWGGPGAELVFEILERVALASLIYFLPATINYILGRNWTFARLGRVLFAAVFYLATGLVSLFTGDSLILGLMAVTAFLLILLFVLVDASRSLPLVGDEVTRGALFSLFGLTFLYLPLAQVLPLITTGQERILFLAGGLYYLLLGATADLFYIRAIVRDRRGEMTEDQLFRKACDQAGLTPREVEIASLIARGSTYKEIASELDISPNTVSNHVATIYRKTGTRSKVEMVNAMRGNGE